MKLIPVGGRGNEYLFRPEGSEIIWLSRAKKGYGRRQNSLFVTNVIEARHKRDAVFALWLNERKEIHKNVVLLCGDHWPNFESKKSQKANATQDSIYYSGRNLLSLMGNLYPDQVTAHWWENVYIPTMRQKRPTRKFFNEHKWLRSFLKDLYQDGFLTKVPKLENPDGERDEGIYLEDDEINAFYEFGTEDLKLQVDLGFMHFMRRSEVLLMPWSEIDFKEKLIYLPAERTKIRKSRIIPINEETFAKLEARKAKSKSPFVFPGRFDKSKPIGRLGNQSAWEGALLRSEQVGRPINPDATFHDLRHSGLTRAVAATNRYAEICKVAGLSLEELERTYLHFQPKHYRFVAELVLRIGGHDADSDPK